MSAVLLTGDPLGWDVGRETSVTIGVFDGVHLGHRSVMRRMVETARERDLLPVALTFDPHPLEFVDPDRAPHLLTTVSERAELLGECGVEILGVLPFLQIRDMAPRVFAEEVLAMRLHARQVAVGENFRFGRDRKGDTDTLRDLGVAYGFDVTIIDLFGSFDGEVVSSTRIRTLVEEGEVEHAADLLGRPFSLTGPVIHGDARGRSIGVPTANLHVPERMAVPAHGVYAARVRRGSSEYGAVVNVGVRPTFGTDTLTVEAHVLDFEDDIYGEELTVCFLRRLREERRFSGVEELTAQIARDVEAARMVLSEGAP